jgi:L-galactose dehydrogenase
MIYRTLGATGLQVSILGFGASPLGGVFRPINEEEGKRAVRVALDLGVNFFDVSPYYGMTRAEIVLGQSLAGVPRERYLLSTKVGRYGNEAKDFDFSADRVARSVDESLKRLGVSHVDMLLCHDIEFGNLNQIVEETLPALRRIVAAGKARFVGITGLPLKMFPAVMDRAAVDVMISYCHYELNDTSLEGLLPYLTGKGVGVISASPLGMGLLTDGGLPAWHPAPQRIKACCAAAAAHCRAKGSDIARLALQFALSRPEIATTLVGMATPEEIAQNVKSMSLPMDRQLLMEVQGILSPVQNQTWASGLPENN